MRRGERQTNGCPSLSIKKPIVRARREDVSGDAKHQRKEKETISKKKQKIGEARDEDKRSSCLVLSCLVLSVGGEVSQSFTASFSKSSNLLPSAFKTATYLFLDRSQDERLE